jgi:hypothetical protein
MSISIVAASYSIFVGVCMVLAWIVLIITGALPDLADQPLIMYYHLAAEAVTAILLIIAGAALHKQKKWATRFYYIASGALFFALLNATGYYAQRDVMIPVLIFTLLTVLNLICMIAMLHFDIPARKGR